MLGTGPGRDFLTIRALFSSLFEAERPKLADLPLRPHINTRMTNEMKIYSVLETTVIGLNIFRLCCWFITYCFGIKGDNCL